MKALKFFVVLNMAALVAVAISANAQQNKERRPSREKWDQVSMRGNVVAIDMQNREILLRGTEGNLVTIEADETVQRFDEISIGDVVNAEFWTYMRAEFRDPTPEEIKEPLAIMTDIERAPIDMAPSGAVGAVVKAVVTLEIINRPDMIVTVKGPKGRYSSIPVSDPTLITQLRIGEVIIITYAEALALSLEKVRVGE